METCSRCKITDEGVRPAHTVQTCFGVMKVKPECDNWKECVTRQYPELEKLYGKKE